MPLEIDKTKATHQTYGDGYIDIGLMKPVYNENKRKIGDTFDKKQHSPIRRLGLTSMDVSLLGANVQRVKEKIAIPYNPHLDEYAITKFNIRLSNVLYEVMNAEKYKNELIIYLVSISDKGGAK